MRFEELQRKLIAAARANPPDDRVPYAFEKRVMALLQARPAPDRWAIWAGALWRGATACLVLMFLLGVFSLVTPRKSTVPNDLSQDFEKTMLAAVDQDADYSR